MEVPGHESARLFRDAGTWRLVGTAVFAHDGQPCRLDYSILCDSDWRTSSGTVAGWIGDRVVRIEISVDPDRTWSLNGERVLGAAGCIDLDLNFSPSTNTLPIRRLGLAIGQEAEVSAAWLRFPSFRLERLEQRYRRIDRETYRYESGGGAFAAELTVNAAGFVTRYGDLWRAEDDGSKA